MAERRLQQVVLDLLAQRDPSSSICPSDAARAAYEGDRAEGWRALMEPVRNAARQLALAGQVEITQGGRRVDPDTARGPIRIRRTRRGGGEDA
ncbi:DUF3253 domain-containing protein [Streptomyces sp. Q6]|uniref:DUF3253 domain-containing protein n=1 Tax=Streptomyces citrinus TaxID=3118173 RepID=A0ACD5ANU6_9ACTN